MPRREEKRQPLLSPQPEREQAKPRRCLRTECVVSALMIGLLAMFVTWGSSSIVKAGYELVQTRACLRQVEKQNELLRMEMARLKSPQRIQQIAMGQLGMIKPQNVYIAAKENNPRVKPRENETIVVRSSVLFGNARAEAHRAQ